MRIRSVCRASHQRGMILGSAAAALVSACSPAAEVPTPAFIQTDSAGVQIAESSGPLWGTSSAWSISDTPMVTIGVGFGDETNTLYDVGDVIRLPNDRIAIVNTGTAQIRVYTTSGQHLLDVGRPGDGPGEFRRIRRLWLTPHDSVVAYDGWISRITVFDSNLELARTQQLQPQAGARQAFALHPFDNGDLLVQEVMPGTERVRQGLFSGGSRRFSRYSREGTRLNPIGEFPSADNWGYTMQGSTAYRLAPFSVVFPPSQGDGKSVFLGPGTRPGVEQRAPDGRLVRDIRWSEVPRPVDAEVIDRFRSWHFSRADDAESRQRASAMLEGLQFPEVLPIYRSLRVDSEGYLWVERYRAPWEEDRRWWVFDPLGRWLGEPPVPTNLDVKEVGADYVLGVERDLNGVESVVMYRLDRGG